MWRKLQIDYQIPLFVAIMAKLSPLKASFLQFTGSTRIFLVGTQLILANFGIAGPGLGIGGSTLCQ